MPSTSDNTVEDLIRGRLERSLESIASAGFCQEIATRIQLQEISVRGVELDGTDGDTKPTRSAQSALSFLVTVEEDMCNVSGSLHGGCGAWLVDLCSSLALLALAGGEEEKWMTSGVSTNLNVNFLKAAPLGTNLRIVAEVLSFGRVTSLLEVKIYNVDTNSLLIVGWHTKQDPQTRPVGVYKL